MNFSTICIAIIMINPIKMRISEQPHSFVVHICCQLTPRFSAFNAVEKVPYIEKKLHESLLTPVMHFFANEVHVVVKRFITLWPTPIEMVSLKYSQNNFEMHHFIPVNYASFIYIYIYIKLRHVVTIFA